MEEQKISIIGELWEGFTWPATALIRFLGSIGVSMDIILNTIGSVAFIVVCVLFIMTATGRLRKNKINN